METNSVPAVVRWYAALTPEQRHAHAVKAGRCHKPNAFQRLQLIARLTTHPTREQALARLAKANAARLMLTSIPRLR